MQKVFLYLYPIKEFMKFFQFRNDKLYDELNIPRPLPILNEAIDKRYRKNGYQIIYALYPDRELYGIEKHDDDKIIYTDITFDEASAIDERGNEKKNFIPKYPNEKMLIEQLGDIDELIVGGFHALDCVKRLGETALQCNINTLVDLDLTDLFFVLYKEKDYFEIENYNPQRFKEYMINRKGNRFTQVQESIFNNNYSSPIYGFITYNRNR